MQASYVLKRSPLSLTLIGSILLIALVLGGISGYVIRGLVGQSALAPVSQPSGSEAASRAVWTSVAPDSPALYEQGGRPDRVYHDAPSISRIAPLSTLPPTIYVQGGRPPIVYSTP